MAIHLTRAQRARLEIEGDEWTRQPSEWKAGIAFLRLEEKGLVEWTQRAAGDVFCGPGAHGHHWLTRRTAKGRQALGLADQCREAEKRLTPAPPASGV